MRTFSKIILCCLLSVSFQTSYSQCDPTLWSHVYHSSRLHVNTDCISVSGTVYSLIYEADGDIHIRLTVDTPYTYMLNATNYSGQYGRLVCEPLCATTVTQADAVASCTGFTNSVYIPAVGEHVIVTGSYVTDNDHGWNEIHPVSKIVIGTSVATANVVTSSPEVTVFPNPAKSKVNFRLSQKPSSPVFITIADQVGRLAGQYQMMETTNLEINTHYLPSGKYFYHIQQDGKFINAGNFVIAK